MFLLSLFENIQSFNSFSHLAYKILIIFLVPHRQTVLDPQSCPCCLWFFSCGPQNFRSRMPKLQSMAPLTLHQVWAEQEDHIKPAACKIPAMYPSKMFTLFQKVVLLLMLDQFVCHYSSSCLAILFFPILCLYNWLFLPKRKTLYLLSIIQPSETSICWEDLEFWSCSPTNCPFYHHVTLEC